MAVQRRECRSRVTRQGILDKKGEALYFADTFPLCSDIFYCHGEFEFGSPKKPAIIEAAALNFADNTDAKMQTFKELLDNAKAV